MQPELEERRAIHARMRAAAGRLRLPFRSHTWRGQTGNWLGAGIGSSIDFQDHRPYAPGDDPRYIDWQAYARTGHYTMKLYREEVSPLADVLLDVSASMFLTPEKAARVVELFYFAVESALRSGAFVRVFAVENGRIAQWPIEAVLSHSGFAELPFKPAAAPRWRPGSLRVFISDLLFPGQPSAWLLALGAGKGRGVILAPQAADESDPDWSGNIEFADCETGRRRLQLVSGDLLARYRAGYARHFALWKEAARKHAVLFSRVAAELEFQAALKAEAIPAGVVELTS
jgi:uncharacterized protein (DUF58 family)